MTRYTTDENLQKNRCIAKLVNSVDACLMKECLVRNVNPTGPSCPKSITAAINEFFEEDVNPDNPRAGHITEWVNKKRRELAQHITLAATGGRTNSCNPCFTISDDGEGQTPDAFKETFLSLPDKSNKLRIPFVQGKFNMGGTGALKFCGRNGLQLILSRRNQKILSAMPAASRTTSDGDWGFTVVRRENPTHGERSSVFTYLAPEASHEPPGKGEVLHFHAAKMPIFPDGSNAYSRTSMSGTLLKLYEYDTTGYSRSHILRRDGLQRRLDLLLPGVALPIRLHECRSFRGHSGSHETTLAGLGVRLRDDRAEKLEKGFPSSAPLKALGESMTTTIYAFKKGEAKTYLKNEGVIFTVNGQTHGHLTRNFFRNDRTIGLSYIADSILVIVDCSDIDGRAREDLFMNSRDRLSKCDLRLEIEASLAELLKQHGGLRDLKNQRREQEIKAKLDDSRPLESILDDLLSSSPVLADLFLKGTRLSNPFRTKKVGSGQTEYKGKKYPTYFHFKGKHAREDIRRNCHINLRCRLTFETDVMNDYFSRSTEQGEFSLYIETDNAKLSVANYVGPNLENGIATLSIRLPETCHVGDTMRFVAEIFDPTRLEPFVNVAVVEVLKPATTGGGKGARRRARSEENGEDRDAEAGIALPKITTVRESEWNEKDPPWDRYTALVITHAGQDSQEPGKDVYDFYINVDNVYLRWELKKTTSDVSLVEARFVFGMILVGLGLLQEYYRTNAHDGKDNDTDSDNGQSIEDKIEFFTRAVAPVLLPAIEKLGDLKVADTEAYDTSGEADGLF